jgi:glycosyltransferase involved in cell wall biosynthesis
VIASLRGAGVDVDERHEPVWEGASEAWRSGAGAALRLARAELRLLRRQRGAFDALLVGYPGHFDLPAARRNAGGAPVVFNPLVSLADTFVSDRRRFRAGSLAARALERIDRWALRAPDAVVADTQANADFLAGLAGLERVEVCFVGAEERVFRPAPTPRELTHVLFVGKLIPLHGLETILAAARLLPDVRFRVVGSGQLDRLLDGRPPNVEWVRWVEYEQLPGELHAASVALGVFGTSAKARRVIPNKAFQALACGTPLVTAGSPAARELLTDGEDALLVPPGDAEALAAALQRLAGDADLRARLAQRGHETYRVHASEAVLGRRWRELLERTVAATK